MIFFSTKLFLTNNNKKNKDQSTARSPKISDVPSMNNNKQVESNEAKNNKILKQPLLNKSSGNYGPIPSGSIVNFVCIDDSDLECLVILEKTEGNITLGPTKIKGNEKTDSFASFYWTSIKGTYKVYAEVKNSLGGSSVSTLQSLEVQ